MEVPMSNLNDTSSVTTEGSRPLDCIAFERVLDLGRAINPNPTKKELNHLSKPCQSDCGKLVKEMRENLELKPLDIPPALSLSK